MSASDDDDVDGSDALLGRLEQAARPCPAIRQHLRSVLPLQLGDVQAAEVRLAQAELAAETIDGGGASAAAAVAAAAAEARGSLRLIVQSLHALDRFLDRTQAAAAGSHGAAMTVDGDDGDDDDDVPQTTPAQLLAELLTGGLELLTVSAAAVAPFGSVLSSDQPLCASLDTGFPLPAVAASPAAGAAPLRPRAVISCYSAGIDSAGGRLLAVVRAHASIAVFLLRWCRKAVDCADAAGAVNDTVTAIVRVVAAQLLQLQADFPGLLGWELRQVADAYMGRPGKLKDSPCCEGCTRCSRPYRRRRRGTWRCLPLLTSTVVAAATASPRRRLWRTGLPRTRGRAGSCSQSWRWRCR